MVRQRVPNDYEMTVAASSDKELSIDPSQNFMKFIAKHLTLKGRSSI